MPRCPHCHHRRDDHVGPCPACGHEVDADRTAPAGPDADRTAPAGAADPPGSSPGGPRPAAAEGPTAGRLAAGTVLLQRYRIRDRLGAGAMGEVYLAEDLTLDQDVALKLLPAEVADDPARQRRFLQEVRLARQVAHPNVCRVYDVGEADGRLLLSMEYVRGRDLGSVLRSIGRFPQEKALDIARQLCAGLAALHDRGVLHRDLKPANVILDDDGRVRITDFGLAGVADRIDARDIRSGTPLYMAPEQLAGREVTARSDLYALGLLIYELFTGRRAFAAETVEQLQSQRESGPATRLSTVVADVDPVIERVIDRCLENDPARRPPSAMAVANALPGGDPLAAALAMGETPSPELVAAAGGAGGLRPAWGLVLLGLGLAGLLLAAGLTGPQTLPQQLDLDRSADALEERARQLVTDLGYTDQPLDRHRTFAPASDLLRWFDDLEAGGAAAGGGSEDAAADAEAPRVTDLRPVPVLLLYRQSPTYLVTRDPLGPVGPDDPPPLTAGMVEVVLDATGRLLQLTAVPAETLAAGADTAGVRDDHWQRLFAAAELDRAALTPVRPAWVPPVFGATRHAWRGDLSTAGRTAPIRVEAASLGGRVVSFRLQGPWSTSERTARGQTPGPEALVPVVVLAVLIAGVTLALRNQRRGRTDLRGAGRLAAVLLVMPLIHWLFSLHHAPLPGTLLDRLFDALADGALFAGFCLMLYLALEPVARRIWPQVLISWTRLMAGGWRDPMVGRSILAGGAMFGIEQLMGAAQPALLRALGSGSPPRGEVDWVALASPRAVVGDAAAMVAVSLFNVLFFLLMLVLLRLVLRRRWLAYGAFILLSYAIVAVQMSDWRLAITLAPLYAVLWSVVLVRGGLLAFAVGFYLARLVPSLPLTLDMSQAHAATSLLVMLAVVALLLHGLSTALAGRPLLRDDIGGR